MTFGICTGIDQSAAARVAGWDFLEIRVDQVIHGEIPDAQWIGGELAATSALPIIAGNVLVLPTMKITGPRADLPRLSDYLRTVMKRAQRLGIQTLIFGSGPARNVEPGVDRAVARRQILDFIRMAASLAVEHHLILAIEHLNTGESNIINTIQEAMTYVMEVNHPNVKCMADCYHFWLNRESLELLHAALPWIVHVHISGADRSPPGISQSDDFLPFFGILKKGGYDGPVSVEAFGFDVARDGRRVLDFVKDQWNQA